MIPIRKIDTLIAFLGFLLFVGGLRATMTSFDPTVGGASSVGNIKLQLTSGLIYLSVMFLILARVERFLSFCKNNLILIVFLLVPLFSVFWSIAPDVTARRGVALVGTSLFAMYIAFALPVERVIRILAVVYAVTASGSLVVIGALPEYGTHQYGDYAGLWRGLYTQKNEFGATMAMAAIVIFLCPKYTYYERMLGRFFVVLCVFLMLMSESRAAWISFACVGFLALAIWRAGGRGSKTNVKVFLSVVTGIVIGFVVIKNANTLLEFIGKDPTLSGRTDVWALALDRAEDRPVLGFGYRAYWIEGNKARLMPEESWADNINHGHNTYLDLFVELGYLGVVAFAITLGFLVYKILSRIKYSNDYINIWAVSGLCFILVRGAAESTILQHADINWVLFVFFFSVFSSYRKPIRNDLKILSKNDLECDESIPDSAVISRTFTTMRERPVSKIPVSSIRSMTGPQIREDLS